MDSDYGSPLFMLRLLAPSIVISIAIMLSLFGGVVLYVLARWRAHRSPTPDPHLGLKFALHWFASSAFQVGLLGLALFIYALISPGSASTKGALYRMAFGAIVPAGLIFGLHALLLQRTNDAEVPGVRRLFLGYNFVVCGLVGFGALMAGFQLLFAKESAGPAGHAVGASVLVYGAAWALVGWKLGGMVAGNYVQGSDDGAGGVGGGAGGGHAGGGYAGASPQAPQPPVAAAPPGLPALGGGSFPPIEQK